MNKEKRLIVSKASSFQLLIKLLVLLVIVAVVKRYDLLPEKYLYAGLGLVLLPILLVGRVSIYRSKIVIRKQLWFLPLAKKVIPLHTIEKYKINTKLYGNLFLQVFESNGKSIWEMKE